MAKKVRQPTPRQIACRANGRKGGLARAKNLTDKQLSEIGQKGGKATLDKLGVDFFAFMTGKRKVVGRYRTPITES